MAEIHLRPCSREELQILDAMDRQAHARDFVIQTGLEAHQKQFDTPGVTYLVIENAQGECCGYFILVLEVDGRSVEFRRILVDEHRRGIGQAAITEMENYCRREYEAGRIWLDVFEDNQLGMHIYEKLGYRRFSEDSFEGRRLFLYEKDL